MMKSSLVLFSKAVTCTALDGVLTLGKSLPCQPVDADVPVDRCTWMDLNKEAIAQVQDLETENQHVGSGLEPLSCARGLFFASSVGPFRVVS